MTDRAKAVLWDYGNVLVRWDPRLLYRKIFKDAKEMDWFLGHVCTMAWHQRHDEGVGMIENSAPLIAKFPEYTAEIEAWRTRFGEMLSGPIPGMGEILDDLARADVRLGMLTNMPAEVVDVCFEGFGQLGHFHSVTVSGFHRVAKPTPEAFQLALSQMGAEAAETLFIDDTKTNIIAAERFGLRAHLFDDAKGVRAALTRAGLLA
jgi:HAD superfamily hydrolase (TIGR01509 family)